MMNIEQAGKQIMRSAVLFFLYSFKDWYKDLLFEKQEAQEP